MTFTGSREPLFFNLHDIYRISTAPLFQFTWYLQDLGSLPLLVYTVFTGSRQPPFFDLHDIYRISRAPLFNLHDIYRISTAPFFDLHDIYRISTAPLFQFTWYLQGLDSPPFSIYVVFTGSRQPLFFNLRGIYNVIYRISTAPLFLFTWYLQGLDSPLFSIYMVFTMSFTGSWQPPFFNLHGLYRISAGSLL